MFSVQATICPVKILKNCIYRWTWINLIVSTILQESSLSYIDIWFVWPIILFSNSIDVGKDPISLNHAFLSHFTELESILFYLYLFLVCWRIFKNYDHQHEKSLTGIRYQPLSSFNSRKTYLYHFHMIWSRFSIESTVISKWIVFINHLTSHGCRFTNE